MNGPEPTFVPDAADDRSQPKMYIHSAPASDGVTCRRGGERSFAAPLPNGSNAQHLPFDEWTETFGTERLTGALLDRLTHHVNILEMNGESYRLAQSRARKSTDTA